MTVIKNEGIRRFQDRTNLRNPGDVHHREVKRSNNLMRDARREKNEYKSRMTDKVKYKDHPVDNKVNLNKLSDAELNGKDADLENEALEPINELFGNGNEYFQIDFEIGIQCTDLESVIVEYDQKSNSELTIYGLLNFIVSRYIEPTFKKYNSYKKNTHFKFISCNLTEEERSYPHSNEDLLDEYQWENGVSLEKELEGRKSFLFKVTAPAQVSKVKDLDTVKHKLWDEFEKFFHSELKYFKINSMNTYDYKDAVWAKNGKDGNFDNREKYVTRGQRKVMRKKQTKYRNESFRMNEAEDTKLYKLVLHTDEYDSEVDSAKPVEEWDDIVSVLNEVIDILGDDCSLSYEVIEDKDDSSVNESYTVYNMSDIPIMTTDNEYEADTIAYQENGYYKKTPNLERKNKHYIIDVIKNPNGTVCGKYRDNEVGEIYKTSCFKTLSELKGYLNQTLGKNNYSIIKDESCSKRNIKEGFYHNIPEIEFIGHGQWADPELIYNGKSFNYHDIEDALWRDFLEYSNGKWKDSDAFINAECEKEFDEYAQDIATSYLDDCIDNGYFESEYDITNEALLEKSFHGKMITRDENGKLNTEKVKGTYTNKNERELVRARKELDKARQAAKGKDENSDEYKKFQQAQYRVDGLEGGKLNSGSGQKLTKDEISKISAMISNAKEVSSALADYSHKSHFDEKDPITARRYEKKEQEVNKLIDQLTKFKQQGFVKFGEGILERDSHGRLNLLNHDSYYDKKHKEDPYNFTYSNNYYFSK